MQITVDDIETALQANPSIRFILLCNPHNPLGVIYGKQNLEDIYTHIFTNYPDLHIISDEMYAHSILPSHKGKFVSALALDAYKQATQEQQQHVHVVWGYVKDFGFNGWRVGIIHSINPQVQEAFDPTNKRDSSIAFISTAISALTDYYLTGFLQAKADTGRPLWEEGMERYPVALQKSYGIVKAKLDEASISYFPYNYAAQFFWVDLRASTAAVGGGDNMTALLATNGLALGPGKSYDASEDGYYRLCYTCYTPDFLTKGLDILVNTVAEIEVADYMISCNCDVNKTVEEEYGDYTP